MHVLLPLVELLMPSYLYHYHHNLIIIMIIIIMTMTATKNDDQNAFANVVI